MQTQKNIPTSLHLMEFSLKFFTYMDTKQISKTQENLNNALHPMRPSLIKTGFQKQQKAYNLINIEQLSTE